jgi:bifunctional UDP-N-acetylglucosamine pyrophosphorylase/glucosamine-1-phosphate N-acetyltransferase
MSVRVIVLAAGQGTRMKSDVPKVLHEAAGRPLLSWVLDAVAALDPDDTVVVIGHGATEVRALLPDRVRTVIQQERLGTGHAVMVALEEIGDVSGDTVVVVPGDTPLLRGQSLAALVAAHGDADATVLTAEMPDPTGYGRVVRDAHGSVAAIVEERDASAAQRQIREVAVSTYVFDGASLSGALGAIGRDNAQGEYYLTDVIGILADGGEVRALTGVDAVDVQGVNSHDQLATVSAVMRARINERLMTDGVWMQDPGRVYVDATVVVEAGARLYPGVHLEGSTRVAAGAVVGPEVYAVDSRIGSGARVWYAVLRDADVGADVEVGPYASLRAGSVLREGAKIGTFVETKNTVVGERSKVPHLSYMGDADIGENSNIGAGTITCNYDGYRKHRTTIGDRAFVGSDTMLVAPVEIGDDAYTGAGSTISRDVPPGALGVERSQQRELRGYAERRAAREAAREAEEA